MIVTLTDGREISVPVAWYPCLAQAKPEQRSNWRLISDGEGMHWPDVEFIGTILGYVFVVAGPILILWLASGYDLPFILLAPVVFGWLAIAVAFLTWRYRQGQEE